MRNFSRLTASGAPTFLRDMTTLIVLFALIVLVGAGAKAIAFRRKLDREAHIIEAGIRDRFLADGELANLPMTVTVDMPISTRTPVAITIVGRIPEPHMREVVLAIVRDEASRMRREFAVVDRLRTGAGA